MWRKARTWKYRNHRVVILPSVHRDSSSAKEPNDPDNSEVSRDERPRGQKGNWLVAVLLPVSFPVSGSRPLWGPAEFCSLGPCVSSMYPPNRSPYPLFFLLKFIWSGLFLPSLKRFLSNTWEAEVPSSWRMLCKFLKFLRILSLGKHPEYSVGRAWHSHGEVTAAGLSVPKCSEWVGLQSDYHRDHQACRSIGQPGLFYNMRRLIYSS